ncbi:MAG: hypothetical protein CFH06_00458 [Alphaproteobacteria bacterium MarineAlpha3_Bin5]|nr:hypothetical protein [Magnetovibrio sp.]PPR79241.1 MAG: hypothetical protein CFH06_00458 [Alphaproteobacteria bacterium MarineAlpha3_Bin5]
MIRTLLKYIYLGAGLLLLIWVIGKIDVSEVVERITEIGVDGFFKVLGIYFLAFLVDCLAWQVTFESVPLNVHWLYRIFAVRIAGEAFNSLLPFANMGGEPLKALVFKDRYGISLDEGGVSLVLAKTLSMVSLIIFLLIGLVLMVKTPLLSNHVKFVATIGLIALVVGTGLFFGIQRFELTTRFSAWLAKLFYGSRVKTVLQRIKELDLRFKRFYSIHKIRAMIGIFFALCNWVLGVVEVYIVMELLGYPVDWETAWIIESVAQMVRAAVFFIPAGLGAQEGAFLFLCEAMTGSLSLGFAVAVVRRFRELTWIILGVAFAVFFSQTNIKRI